jgi:G3E family GTPase
VTAIAIRRDRPVPAAALALFLQSLAAQCGSRLLRLKGLVELAEQPGRPVVVHGVQHVFSPPVRLPAWPAGADGSADRATRLVLIGQNIPRWFPLRLLDAITAEVEDERDSAAGADAERRRPQGIVVRTPSMAAPMSADSDIGRP